jgi:acetyl/propionyl-CoA carboxylase alpha subunit/acetyl-CoA carboxylase carboxyltransferase component
MPTASLRRLAIADTGAGAVRAQHAARELGSAPATVALHSAAEERSLWVRRADEAVRLAGADAPDGAGLEAVLESTRADVLWPGWGQPQSHLALAQLCERHGIRFAGSDPSALQKLAEPNALAALAAEAGVAVADGAPSGSDVVHIDVQALADARGTVWIAGLRDASCRRHGRQVLTESASTRMTPELEGRLRKATEAIVRDADLRGVATVGFHCASGGEVALVSVTPYLQPEHLVTEEVTGLDLARAQLEQVLGGPLEGEPPPSVGHAVAVRLAAADPARGFASVSGRLSVLRLPTGPGLRVDTGYGEGDDLTPGEDAATIAEICAHGRDRDQALTRLKRALEDTLVVIEGGTTNQSFLLELLSRPELQAGAVDATWVDRLEVGGDIAPLRHADVALVQAAIDRADADTAVDRGLFFAYARRGRPTIVGGLARVVHLRHQGAAYRFQVSRLGPERYRLVVDGAVLEADVEHLSAHERRLTLGEDVYRTVISARGDDVLVEVNGVPHHVLPDEGDIVRSPAPAVVVSLPVAAGDKVAKGDVVAVIESMKMETSLQAPYAGRVRQVLSATNVAVSPHAPLVRIDPEDAAPAATPAQGRVRFTATSAGDQPTGVDRLRWLLLGYDVPDADIDRLLADPGLEAASADLLALAADVQALSRTLPEEDENDTAEAVEQIHSPQELFNAYLRSLDPEGEGLPANFVALLEKALSYYGITSLERSTALESALHRLFRSHQRAASARKVLTTILDRALERGEVPSQGEAYREALDHLIAATDDRDPMVSDIAREARYRFFEQPVIEGAREATFAEARASLAALERDPEGPDRSDHVLALVHCPEPIAWLLTTEFERAQPKLREALLEVMTRRYYRMRHLDEWSVLDVDGRTFVHARYTHKGRTRHVLATFLEPGGLEAATRAVGAHALTVASGEHVVADFFARNPDPDADAAGTAAELHAVIEAAGLPEAVERVVVAHATPERGRSMSAVDLYTYRRDEEGHYNEDPLIRGIHPLMSRRLQLWRMENFKLTRLPSAEDVYLFHGVAHANPKDERVFAIAEVRTLTPIEDEDGNYLALPELEHMLNRALEDLRRFQAHRPPRKRLHWNRVMLYCWPQLELDPAKMTATVERMAPATAKLGIESVLVRTGERLLRFFNPGGRGVVVEDDPPTEPLQPLDAYAQKVVGARRRGAVYPYELVKLLAGVHPDSQHGSPPADWQEYDFDEAHTKLVPVDRPPGQNKASIVVGVAKAYTKRYPEGMARVTILGDPTRALGALAEPECSRINAALDLAEELNIPAEWYALSAGAKIAMDSGSENMDWISAVLRRLIEFTQAGNEINVVVTGINVGAQPYWNAEATMLMHTKGILVMMPQSAMVLTGKQALDYAGGVSADDNFGIGGYERIMGPNGQAQYWAPDLASACRILLDHYDHAYVAPGERWPRRAETTDPFDRDVREAPHSLAGSDLVTVGDIVSDAANPERKKPFDIRSVMRAVVDADHPPLERWINMEDADTSVVWDAHVGGWPVCMIGFESHNMQRYGRLPADGPERWTSGTLFPMSSKKTARAINSASGSRPLVVLANLSGFDGSPESMRRRQLEFGAEIGRAIVNFDGPVVFCVVSRYHGGAFVVFSKKLHDCFEAIALEGSRASVLGGSAAAAVVFTNQVEERTRTDTRVAELEAAIAQASGGERQELRAKLAEIRPVVRSEKLGEVAGEFDAIHSVQRAQKVGSVDIIIPPATTRPYLIEAIERGMRKWEGMTESSNGRRRVVEPVGR